MVQFLFGSIVTACAVIGLFFLRFWRRTRDRLFACFGITFWLLGAEWLAHALVTRSESQTPLYLIRLVAFLVLLLGIWDKNRGQGRRTP